MSAVKTQKKSQIEAIYPLSPMQQGMLFNALFNTDVKTDFVQLRFIFRDHPDRKRTANRCNGGHFHLPRAWMPHDIRGGLTDIQETFHVDVELYG